MKPFVDDLRLEALAEAYRSGRVTPRALFGRLLERVPTLNAEYRLFITPPDAAGIETRLAALEGQSPDTLPLYGVPFAIKDNIDLEGHPTSAGCPAYAYLPEASAAVVERLVGFGAVPFGKTNLDAFATGLVGMRSPYGECPNSVLPEYPSGGSSSGSALAVALGLASFALGTDTAGSGRVPAALNNLVGLKPTRGRLSARGLVPACRSLDCMSLFTATAREASRLLAFAGGFDAGDPYSRRAPAWAEAGGFGRPGAFRFGVPRDEDLVWFGCEQGPALFAKTREALAAVGGEPVEIDFQPFLEAAALLYQVWVAERDAAFGAFVNAHPDQVQAVIHQVLAPASALSGADVFRAQHRLQALKRHCDARLETLDLVVTPTLPRARTRADIRERPVEANSEFGTYTNFMNLLDYAAVAVPAGFLTDGLPWGVTLFSRAFTDHYLLSVADALQRQLGLPLAGARRLDSPAPTHPARHDRARVVVCGAHLEGLPLNPQLTARGARLVERTRSAPVYRLYALAGGPPFRPGMVVDASQGAAIDVEVWELPSAELGSFLTGIPAPLGLGKVQLADGRWETGFICEGRGLDGAEDITRHGGWRAYLAAKNA